MVSAAPSGHHPRVFRNKYHIKSHQTSWFKKCKQYIKVNKCHCLQNKQTKKSSTELITDVTSCSGVSKHLHGPQWKWKQLPKRLDAAGCHGNSNPSPWQEDAVRCHGNRSPSLSERRKGGAADWPQQQEQQQEVRSPLPLLFPPAPPRPSPPQLVSSGSRSSKGRLCSGSAAWSRFSCSLRRRSRRKRSRRSRRKRRSRCVQEENSRLIETVFIHVAATSWQMVVS